jgi:peptidoglycan/LPS O-acetylase OafA/YrhL
MTNKTTPTDSPEKRPAPRFYLPQLDGLRFLAFLLVFFHHAQPLSTLFVPGTAGHGGLHWLEKWGWCGVDLFLVLSAFLITSLLLLEHGQTGGISLRGFYLRRILRIWPLYYFMILLGFVVFPYFGFLTMPMGSPEYTKLIKDHLLAYCTLFGNYSCGAHGYPERGFIAHLWTVTLEEQFYLVWPVVLSLLIRFRRFALWIFLAALWGGTLWLRSYFIGARPSPFVWTNTLTRLDPLLCGIMLALWRHRFPARPGRWLPLVKLAVGAGVVYLITFGPMIYNQPKSLVWQLAATAVGFTLILDACLPRGKNPFAWVLARAPLVWLGRLTYGLYVYHLLGLKLSNLIVDSYRAKHPIVSPAAHMVSRWGIALALTILIAFLSYRFFEGPFLRLKNRFSRVRSGA